MARAEHWYAVETPPQKEWACSELLKRSGFTPWIPTYQKRKKVGRAPVRYANVDKPFIPSLVFVDVGGNLEADMWLWSRLASCRLVRHIIGNGETPKAITKEQIDRMAETRGQLHALELARAEAARVSVDSPVTVTAGAFQGVHGTVKELQGHRAKVLLEFFGSTRDVEIGVAHLIAAE